MALVQEITVPLISVNDTSLTVVEIPKRTGDPVKSGDNILVFETSKTIYNVEANADGFIEYLCEEGNDYDVNQLVAKIYSEASEIKIATVNPGRGNKAIAAPVLSENNWEGETLFSADALVLIAAKGLSAASFTGRDFVNKVDVEQLLGISKPAPKISSSAPAQKKPASPAIDHSSVILEKLTSNKKREIEYLSDVQSTGLTSTINTTIETDGLFTHVNRQMQYLKNSLLPLIIYETSRLLLKYKALNAFFSDNSIAYYNEVNIGFAVDIDKGLKVLKVPEAHKRSMQEIETDIMELSGKYLDDHLEVQDLTGVSFTITDLSAESVAFFRPLINMMNSAILGISSIDEKLKRCTLSVTFDHRVTEGKYVAGFLKELKERLESYQSGQGKHDVSDISCFKCYNLLKDDPGDVGFAKCITPAGDEAYICQSCLKGF